MNWLLDSFLNIVYFFADILGALINSIYNMLCDAYYSICNTTISIITYFVDMVFSLLQPLDLSQYLNGLPSDAVNVLCLVGFPQALGMILISLTIRFTLQLIPFVRLGS